jgi:glycosyltransferase involved in cell wall biosynthesis
MGYAAGAKPQSAGFCSSSRVPLSALHMKFLFVHQNFPGQYLHLVRHLAAIAGNEVVFITQRTDATLPGVKKIVYQPARQPGRGTHHYLRDTEAAVLNAQAVARVALDLRDAGFRPDVMLGHNGWGEIWYLKDVFPSAPLIGYFEFFYRAEGADVGFAPDEQEIFDTRPRIRTKNVGNLLGLDAADWGQCPTQWQKSTYPAVHHGKLQVIHEGIDTQAVRPDARARLRLPELGLDLGADDEVVTYVARNLEPYRGFPSFMRSLPAILAARPKARVLIVGGDEVSYGARLPAGKTFRQLMLKELGDALDLSRVHFLGKVPYPNFVQLLQISRAHVYLTYPFVLSWSMLEAMSAGCLVIGSRTAPVEEVIRDGVNGLLVDIFNPAQIADRVIAALADPKAFDEVRKNARATIVERYDLRRICLPAQLDFLSRVTGGDSARQPLARVAARK